MTKIIGVIQVKGGAGRSTVATNLAVNLSMKYSTTLVDCDLPQGTAASWWTVRQEVRPDEGLQLATAANHNELVKVVESLDSQIIIIDCPPRIAEITRAALILSDLCLIPLGASAVEMWATDDLLQTIQEAKQVKPDVDARIAWNRFRAHTRSAQELAEDSKDIPLKQLKTRLGYRVAYSEALARGLAASEWTDKVAQWESRELAKEVGRIIKTRV